jgi:TRAP-type mannitol/chloroaromatic compound transport system substrate-binding protein
MLEQLRGLKYRTVGLATDLFNALGAAVTILPGGEIVPALERGVIDGAEFNNPSSDRVLGFPDVAKNYMMQSYHQNTETFEILFNKAKYDALPAELKAIIRHSAEAASADMSWKQQLRYPKDLQAMAATQGVNVQDAAPGAGSAAARLGRRVIATSKDAFFKKVTTASATGAAASAPSTCAKSTRARRSPTSTSSRAAETAGGRTAARPASAGRAFVRGARPPRYSRAHDGKSGRPTGCQRRRAV